MLEDNLNLFFFFSLHQKNYVVKIIRDKNLVAKSSEIQKLRDIFEFLKKFTLIGFLS